MKKYLFFIVSLVFIVFISIKSNAQNIENPGTYMSAVSSAHEGMNKTYMSYMSAAAHSGKAKKIENMRQKVLQSITDSKYKTIDLPYYKGDNSLRQSSINYIQLCYKIFDEDYGHIVNMEDIVEQSYDEMEAYLLLQEKTNEKLQEAEDSLNNAVHAFATKYNVTLTETKDDLGNKLEAASEVNHYRNEVYLLFFKSNWEDGQITDAMNKHKVNDMEQSRSALVKYATEGLASLGNMKPFQNDNSLINGCKKALEFYKNLGEVEIPKMVDYFIKEENFEKQKKTFDATPENQRTKAMVDSYNKTVDDMNKAVNVFNQTINNTNAQRAQVLQAWQDSEKNFLDAPTPYYN